MWTGTRRVGEHSSTLTSRTLPSDSTRSSACRAARPNRSAYGLQPRNPSQALYVHVRAPSACCKRVRHAMLRRSPCLPPAKRHRTRPCLRTTAAAGPVQARTATSQCRPRIMPTWPVSRQWAVKLRAAASVPPTPHRAPLAWAAGRARLLPDVLLRDEVGEGDALAGAEGHGAVVGDVGAVKREHDVAALQHLARGRGGLHAPHVHALLPGLLARRRRSSGKALRALLQSPLTAGQTWQRAWSAKAV